jgi:hypothetical protein
MPDNEEPGLLDGIENKVAALSDDHRATLPREMRTDYDVKIGIAKGAYGFTKSLVSGLIDLTTFATKLMGGDQETYKKVGEAAWGVTKFVAKNFYYEKLASAEEKQKYEQEINDKANAIYQNVKSAVVKAWDEAKAQGKEAELISKWSTRGILEVAALFVGAGEVKAAAKASEAAKLSEAAKVLEAAEVGCDVEKGAEAAKASRSAAEADKLTEAQKLGKTEKPAPPEAQVPPPGKGYHKETISPKPLKPEHVKSEQEKFLGPGPYSNKHPRTGQLDPDRVVSADGKRSIRYGNHEKNSPPAKHHYHEETWTYDAKNNVMNVDNTVRRVPLPKPKEP